MAKIHNKKGLISIQEYIQYRMDNDDLSDIINSCSDALQYWYEGFDDKELKDLGLKR